MRLRRIGDRTFRSLRRHRNYRLYFAGSAISFIGTWMQQIAADWLAFSIAGTIAILVAATGAAVLQAADPARKTETTTTREVQA